MSLSRELHLWLQSLDLSTPIKQPRRDFSNGYLIAEVLSRYHPTAIDLHHYRRASSLDSKLSNWAQLERSLQRLQLDLPKPCIDALLHAQPQAHVVVLTMLYEQLTGKAVHTFTPPPPSVTTVPSFLSSTASTVVKQRLQDVDVVGGLSTPLDTSGTVKAVERTLQSFDEEKREERKRQSTRIRQHMAQQRMVYQTLEKAGTAAAPPPATPQCSLKTVTIRQTATPLIASLPSLMASSMKPGVTRSSSAALNAVIINSPHYTYRQTASPFTEFTQSLTDLPDDTVAAVVDAVILDALEALTTNALTSPKDFYTTITALFPLLTQCELTSLGFQSSLTLITQLGHRLREKDGTLATALSLDFLLSKLLPLIQTQPSKLHMVMPLLYAFCIEASEARATLLTSLSSLISPPSSLLLTVSALLQVDVSPSTIHATLPYVASHLQSDDPVVRALAISLLAPIAGEGAATTVWQNWWQVIHTSATALPHPTWYIQAEAVHVICSLLASEGEEGDTEGALVAIDRVMKGSTSFPLIASVLPHIAQVLGLHPSLRPLFFSLLDRVEGVKDFALASLTPSDLPSDTVALMQWFTVDLRAVWSPTLIVQAILDHLRVTRASSPISPLFVEVMACAVSDASSPAFSSAFSGLTPALLQALLPSLPSHPQLVLATLTLLLSSPVTRGYGLTALHPVGTALLPILGLRCAGAMVEWMWGWVEGSQGGEEETWSVIEAMRRMAVGWKTVLSEAEWEEAGLTPLIQRMEGRGKAKESPAADRTEWEEKGADILQC